MLNKHAIQDVTLPANPFCLQLTLEKFALIPTSQVYPLFWSVPTSSAFSLL